MKNTILTIIIGLFSVSISAANSSTELFDVKDFYAGVGTITQFVGRVQTDESGSTEKFDFNPYLTIGTEFAIYEDFSFSPEFSFTFPKESRDSNMTKWTYWAQFLGVYTYQDFKFKFGPALVMNKISSEGGTQTLDNGTSTSDFPMPNGSSTSRNMTINGAVEWKFIKEASARFEGWIVNITDSESMAFSYTFSFYYHFGNTLW